MSSTFYNTGRLGLVLLAALLVLLPFFCAAAPSHYQLGVVGDSQVGGVRMINIQVNSDADFDYKRHDWSLNIGCPIVAVLPGGDLDPKNGRRSERGWAESTTQQGSTDFNVHVETEGWDLLKGNTAGYVHSKFVALCMA